MFSYHKQVLSGPRQICLIFISYMFYYIKEIFTKLYIMLLQIIL